MRRTHSVCALNRLITIEQGRSRRLLSSGGKTRFGADGRKPQQQQQQQRVSSQIKFKKKGNFSFQPHKKGKEEEEEEEDEDGDNSNKERVKGRRACI